MLSIVYSEEVLGLTETTDPYFDRMSYAWTKDQFRAMSPLEPNDFHSVTYDPGRSQLVVIEAADPTRLLLFDNPADHPALDWMDQSRASLVSLAQAAVAEQRDYVWNGSDYVPRIETLTIEEIRAELMADSNRSAFNTFQQVVMLAEVGERAGLNIQAAVDGRIANIHSWLIAERLALSGMATIGELLAYDPTPPLDTLESDVQWVMNQV